MPRNITGGSGHKARANSEGNITKKNRQLIENFIEDVTVEGKCDGVFVSKVIRRLGDGRMEVSYMDNDRLITVSAPIKGSLRGRGKSQAFVDIGSFVLVTDTGLEGSRSHEIIGVVTPAQLAQMKKIMTLDTRIIDNAKSEDHSGEVLFEEADEEDTDGSVEIDNI